MKLFNTMTILAVIVFQFARIHSMDAENVGRKRNNTVSAVRKQFKPFFNTKSIYLKYRSYDNNFNERTETLVWNPNNDWYESASEWSPCRLQYLPNRMKLKFTRTLARDQDNYFVDANNKIDTKKELTLRSEKETWKTCRIRLFSSSAYRRAKGGLTFKEGINIAGTKIASFFEGFLPNRKGTEDGTPVLHKRVKSNKAPTIGIIKSFTNKCRAMKDEVVQEYRKKKESRKNNKTLGARIADMKEYIEKKVNTLRHGSQPENTSSANSTNVDTTPSVQNLPPPPAPQLQQRRATDTKISDDNFTKRRSSSFNSRHHSNSKSRSSLY